MPLFDKYKDKLPTALANLGDYVTGSSGKTEPANAAAASMARKGSLDGPFSSDASSEGGLAYADSSDEDDDPVDYRKQDDNAKGMVKKGGTPPGRSMLRAASNASDATSRIRFPAISERSSRDARQYDDDDSGSAYSDEDDAPRRGGKVANHRTRSSKSDYERDSSVPRSNLPVSPARRSNTLESPTTPSFGRVPARSKTAEVRTPEAVRRDMERQKPSSSQKKVKVCARCEVRIEDGRWVAVDGGRAMCEKCWKNMYLPKVCAVLVRLRP